MFFLLLIFSFVFSSSYLHAQTPDELNWAYSLAIQDAAIAEASEIVDTLTAITFDNKNLIWKDTTDGRQVLMVTWTDWDGYDSLVGESVRMSNVIQVRSRLNVVPFDLYTATRDIWVTAVPEVQQFVRENSVTAGQSDLRVRQLLGLPYDSVKTRFVEFWVDPNDLFRPSPDPEINDNTAQLDYPPNVSQEHRQWIETLKSESYGDNGYPWTRLGYTYDWGNPESKVGLSEFVIRTDAVVDVHSVTLSAQYLGYLVSVNEWSLH